MMGDKRNLGLLVGAERDIGFVLVFNRKMNRETKSASVFTAGKIRPPEI